MRPTSDKVKEALFAILGPPTPRPGERFLVLDLFAGTGALGLEALSRGAHEAWLVEQDKKAADVAERNIENVGVVGRAHLLRREVGSAIKSLDKRFDWVFLDPPYEGGTLDRALRLLGTTTLVGGVAIAEHDLKGAPDERYGCLSLADRRSWGSTALSFYRSDEAPGEG